MVDLDADPDAIAPVVEGVRIFAGLLRLDDRPARGRDRARRLDCAVRVANRCAGRAAGRPVGAGAAPSAAAVVAAGQPPDRHQPQLKRRCAEAFSLQDSVQVAQAPPQPPAAAGVLRARRPRRPWRSASSRPRRCRPRRRRTRSPRRSPVCGGADSATTPPAASITAAASWVGATARSTWRTESPERGRVSSHTPSAGGRDGGAQTQHRGDQHAPHNTSPRRCGAGWGVPRAPGFARGTTLLSRQSQ